MKFVFKGPINNEAILFSIISGRRAGNKPSSDQISNWAGAYLMLVVEQATSIRLTKYWIDTYIMLSAVQATSHCLTQCWADIYLMLSVRQATHHCLTKCWTGTYIMLSVRQATRHCLTQCWTGTYIMLSERQTGNTPLSDPMLDWHIHNAEWASDRQHAIVWPNVGLTYT